MDEGRRLRLIGNIRSHLRALEMELGRIATCGNAEASAALRAFALSLLEQGAHAIELAIVHERAQALEDPDWDRDTETNLERPEL